MLQMANVVKAIGHDSAIKYKNAPMPWIWFNMSPPFHNNHITGQKRIGNNLGCSQEEAIHLECIPKHDVKVSANDLWHLLTIWPQSACKCTHCLCIKKGNILQSSQVQLNLVWENNMHHPTWNSLPWVFAPFSPVQHIISSLLLWERGLEIGDKQLKTLQNFPHSTSVTSSVLHHQAWSDTLHKLTYIHNQAACRRWSTQIPD